MWQLISSASGQAERFEHSALENKITVEQVGRQSTLSKRSLSISEGKESRQMMPGLKKDVPPRPHFKDYSEMFIV